MKIRRFTANNLQEAVQQAKLELGQDAMIIHTRKFKQGGFLGLFAKPRVEITVALDDVYHTEEPTGSRITDTGRPQEVAIAREEEATDHLMEELKSVKELVAELSDKIGDKDKLKGLPRSIQSLHRSLVNNHVSEKLALRIARSVQERMEAENTRNQERAQEICFEVIKRLLKKPKPIEFNKGRPRIVAMIGPTGVGKTTTVAKLAANFTLLEKKQVGLVTIDTYRIAAIEQLKTYAEIIGVPLEVVFQPKGLKVALMKLRDKDLIFIDTAGRSPRNELQITELAEFLQAGNPDEIILVLSTNTHTSDLLDIYHRFDVVRIDKLVFTKLDESKRYGQILNVVHGTKTNLAYVTNGQNVPDDIEVPDVFYLAKMILGEGINE